MQTTLEEEGQQAYLSYCAGCHGLNGDGNGEAARFLAPRPRNFQASNFKFSSTRSGQLPTDEDLKRSIVQGLKGSAMPGWDLLPARTIDALIAYLKTFSPKWESRKSAPRIPTLDDPYRTSTDRSPAILRGEAVYHGFATCWTCHPAYVSTERINEYLVLMENPPRDVFRDRLFESEGKPNTEGEVIYPPDFRRDFVRSGGNVEDLYRSIGAGITGTAMPTWIDSMDYPSGKPGHGALVESHDVWAMAYYVQNLILNRPAKLTPEQVAVRLRPQKVYPPGVLPAPTPLEPAVPAGTEFTEEEEFVDD